MVLFPGNDNILSQLWKPIHKTLPVKYGYTSWQTCSHLKWSFGSEQREAIIHKGSMGSKNDIHPFRLFELS